MNIGSRKWMLAFVLLAVPLGMLPGLWHATHDLDRWRGDESGWVTAADYYSRLILHGEGGSWDPQPEFGAWGSMTPALGKLLLGTALPAGPPIRAFYRFDDSREWNEAHGHVPPAAALVRVRRLSALAATVGLVLFGWLVHRWRGLGVALLAQLLVAGNPLVRDFSASATPDLIAVTLTLAGALLCIAVAEQGRRALLGLAAAVGATVGAAAAVKLNYATAALIFPATLALGLFRSSATSARRSARRLATALAIFVAAGAFVHLASDPYLWHPDARPGFWRPGDPAWQTTTPGRLALRVADWRRLIDRQQDRALPSGVLGGPVRFEKLFQRATGAAHGVPVDAPLACLGLGSVMVAFGRRRRAADQAMAAFVLAQGLVAVLIIPLDFSRYFLPPLLPLAALTAEGARVTLTAAWKLRGVARRRDGA